MSLVEKFEDGFKIGDKILYWVSGEHKGYVHCATVIGPEMQYEKLDYTLIDYPGEYDVSGILVEAFVSEDDVMHYVFQMDDSKYVLVNKKAVLKDMDTNKVDMFFSTNPKMQEILEKMEYEGGFELLG